MEIKMPKEVVARRFKLLREHFNLSQDDFAKKISVSKRTLANYELGHTIPHDNQAKAISEKLEINQNWLLDSLGEYNDVPIQFVQKKSFLPLTKNPNLVEIPIFEALAGCGASGMVEQLVIGEDSFLFDSRVFPHDIISKNIAMIRIVGDSMAPYLDENDWALIELRNGRNIEPIEAVYLIEYEGSVQIKRVQVIGKKAIIKSDNKEYSPFELKINEFDIVGKIVARLKFGSPMLVRG